MAMFKKIPYRDEGYMLWVREQPCLVCGFVPCDPHHEATGGMATKATDLACISLCHLHHEERHRIGKKTFSEKYRIDLVLAGWRCLMKYICSSKGNNHEDFDWNFRV